MSGRLLLYNICTDKVLGERRDHKKYAVKVTSWSSGEIIYVATAGWDAKVILYSLNTADGRDPLLGEPIATLGLETVPEAMLFIQSPDVSLPVLLLTRRDSTFLYYYALPPPTANTADITLLGKQNLAPRSNAWVAFTPVSVEQCPSDPSLAAVATSSLPHMRLIIVRLLIPLDPNLSSTASAQDPEQASNIAADSVSRPCDTTTTTQASQARAALLVQDREEAAISIQCSTLSPQTPYSTPRCAWRPDGTGVWVNSDDGVIRGFEASTGKLVANLEAHEAGSKIRCLWAGHVKVVPRNSVSNHSYEDEWLISGGFDQKLVIWRAA
ncbi:hypothetical protein K469DRAFT_315109 [Zopfia rhizophila CBS 207.26]|uniref:WD40 repeat-like protein n=1 Tax=Zopfia rhizophila CBS 207.26 TaxID=1314779 RepID=A0A6A6EPI0_9PEZI|nr:hypothetical protein K469DRAFT_315109 [Zopfia rhizophila CBS 207.26]